MTIRNHTARYWIEAPHAFRTTWGDCNTGFLAAGMAIQKIDGRSWDQYFHDEIFKPLKMKRTCATIAEMKDKLRISNSPLPINTHSKTHSYL